MIMETNNIYLGDCLELMQDIPDNSIDCVICDLPYGVLNSHSEGGSWDSVIPLTYYYSQNGVEVSVKRLCAFAKGKNAPAFSCCFINNDGQKKIDVDTEDTFKVIYSDGTTTNDWIFKGIK